MSPSEVLRAAADLIEQPGAWNTGSFARSENDVPCDPRDEAAKCWCVSGAIQKIEGPNGWQGWNLFDGYARMRGYRHMADFNDDKSQPEVVAALRNAAHLADRPKS